MQDKTHNGWTNYATWRVNLEFFSDNVEMYCEDIEDLNLSRIVSRLETDIENYIMETSEEGLAQDYAFAFLQDVNYWEIAEHIKDEYITNYCCDNCNEPLEEQDGFCSDKCKKEYWLLADHPKG